MNKIKLLQMKELSLIVHVTKLLFNKVKGKPVQCVNSDCAFLKDSQGWMHVGCTGRTWKDINSKEFFQCPKCTAAGRTPSQKDIEDSKDDDDEEEEEEEEEIR
jgi:hypothetical protein